jgi:hypothetical protein
MLKSGVIKRFTIDTREKVDAIVLIKTEANVPTEKNIRNHKKDSLSTQYNPDRREISIYLGQMAHIEQDNYQDVVVHQKNLVSFSLISKDITFN